MIQATREQRRALARENAKRPAHLEPVPRVLWPERAANSPHLVAVWRSRDYLVQVFDEGNNVTRLSINRTMLHADRWLDDIPWDDLQRLKREAGFGELDAVEVFPPDLDLVNVANMRHLWVFTDGLRLPFAWRRKA